MYEKICSQDRDPVRHRIHCIRVGRVQDTRATIFEGIVRGPCSKAKSTHLAVNTGQADGFQCSGAARAMLDQLTKASKREEAAPCPLLRRRYTLRCSLAAVAIGVLAIERGQAVAHAAKIRHERACLLVIDKEAATALYTAIEVCVQLARAGKQGPEQWLARGERLTWAAISHFVGTNAAGEVVKVLGYRYAQRLALADEEGVECGCSRRHCYVARCTDAVMRAEVNVVCMDPAQDIKRD